MKKYKLSPKLSTKKIKLILSGKYKRPNKKSFLLAITTAMFACRASMINSMQCIDKFSKALRMTELALNFASSVKEISNIK